VHQPILVFITLDHSAMTPLRLEPLHDGTDGLQQAADSRQKRNSFRKFDPFRVADKEDHHGKLLLTLLAIASNGVESATFNMDYASLPPEELVRTCAQLGSVLAWQEFIRRFNPLIAGVAIRTARRWGNFPRSLIDDLVQETYLKLCTDNCKLLRTFESREPESIYSYLKVVTVSVVHDHFKAMHAAKRWAGDNAEDIEVVSSSSTVATQVSPGNQASVERHILMQEIDTQLQKSVAEAELRRCRLIFWLYYRSGLSASAIASIPSIGLTTKGVESMLLRLTRLVRVALTESAQGREKKQQGPSQNERGIAQEESF
jgi:RNA polymerase sigma-70 factor (ECF subfamily)